MASVIITMKIWILILNINYTEKFTVKVSFTNILENMSFYLNITTVTTQGNSYLK
jgi:hypothetical protein